jgi:hypothetical protein
MARLQTKNAGGSYHRFSRITRHSLRDGFTAYSGLSPGTGLSCSRHEQSFCSLDTSVGVSGPHAFAVRDNTFVRRAHRAHRIPTSNVRDDA